jgi:hypothetical protein
MTTQTSLTPPETGSNTIPALLDIQLPPHVNVETTSSLDGLMSEIVRRQVSGFSGHSFFGTCFVQGNRLQFLGAAPIHKLAEISKIDQSSPKVGVAEVMAHANRPKVPAHSRELREYLLQTACAGEKFILPAFAFNYGCRLDENDPVVTVVIFSSGGEGPWPAILLLPHGAKLDKTDGAHRGAVIDDILTSNKVTPERKEALRRNAVAFSVIFESVQSDAHQDFADCAKARPLPKSLVTTFDVRDERNERSRDLVRNFKFLAQYVDATAANVNLSARSRKAWSMSAVRMFVAHVVEHSRAAGGVVDKTRGAEAFFSALIRHMPQLKALDKAMKDPSSDEASAGSLRDVRGGDVALRGVGMAIFARAFLFCVENGIEFDAMAKKLGSLDWHVLKCERVELERKEKAFDVAVRDQAQDLWVNLLVIGERSYRIRSSSLDVDGAWAKILPVVEGLPKRAAA